MHRPPHGATTRPGPNRPAAGYGRSLGRPGPSVVAGGSGPVDAPVTDGDAAGAGIDAPVGDQAVIAASAFASPGEPGPVPAI
jgi:hypothetical protein